MKPPAKNVASRKSIPVPELQAMEKRLLTSLTDIITDVLKNVVTKQEFINASENFATKEDLNRVEEKVDRLQQSMVSKADISDMVGELRATREELAATNHLYSQMNSRVDNHEKRIRGLELSLA